MLDFGFFERVVDFLLLLEVLHFRLAGTRFVVVVVVVVVLVLRGAANVVARLAMVKRIFATCDLTCDESPEPPHQYRPFWGEGA